MPLATAVNIENLEDAFLWLITVTDPVSNVVLLGVNNLEDVTSRGKTYTAFPFELVLPTDDGQRPQSMELRCMNVAQELTQVMRATLAPPKVKLELVLSSTPDVVEKTLDHFVVQDATYDSRVVTFTLSPSNAFARKTVSADYNQREFPALFFSIPS